MKHALFVAIFGCFAFTVKASDDSLRLTYPQVYAALGAGFAPSLGKPVFSMPVLVGVQLSQHWSAGLGCYVGARKLSTTVGYSAEKPSLSLTSAGLFGSFHQPISKRFAASASIMGSVTAATLQDRAESRLVYTGKTYVRRYKTVENATFFLAQPSLSLSYQIDKYLALAGSLRYDYTRGRTR